MLRATASMDNCKFTHSLSLFKKVLTSLIVGVSKVIQSQEPRFSMLRLSVRKTSTESLQVVITHGSSLMISSLYASTIEFHHPSPTTLSFSSSSHREPNPGKDKMTRPPYLKWTNKQELMKCAYRCNLIQVPKTPNFATDSSTLKLKISFQTLTPLQQ